MLSQCPNCCEVLSETDDAWECAECGFSLNKVFVPFLPIRSIEHINVTQIQDEEIEAYGIGSL